MAGGVSKRFGLDKGFDFYIENFKPYLWDKPAEDVNTDFFNLIKKIKEEKNANNKKSFFWIHYSDPHEPYFPPGKDGNFNLLLNEKKIVSFRSTDQAIVNVDIHLKPGLNLLKMNAIVSPIFIYDTLFVAFFQYNMAIRRSCRCSSGLPAIPGFARNVAGNM